MRERRSKKFLLFLFLSLLFHSLLLLLIAHRPPEPAEPEVATLDLELLRKPKQIADIAPPKKPERPEKADFIGIYDSKVPEQQVAATPPRPPGVAQPQPKVTEPPEPTPSKTPADDKSLATLFAMKKEQARRKDAAKPPSWQKYGELPEDFYPDYKVGPHTYLNVLRFPDVQYFVRLKRIFKMTFNPGPALRNYMYSNLVSRGQIEVVLGVVVDPTGRLAHLFVIRGSGFDRYDAEALRTVRDSAPFAKPPTKILDESGLLRMSWTFTVYM